MVPMRALRADPYFAPCFAHVHWLFWPVLVWQINRFFNWVRRENITDALYAVSRFGFITVRYRGDTPDPTAYKPVPRTFRPLTDAGYASDVPIAFSDLAILERLTAVPILPRFSGGGGISLCEMTEGALPSILDST